MNTINQCLQYARRNNIPSSEAILLLSQITNLSKEQIFMNPEAKVSEKDELKFEEYCLRLLQKEPITKILEEKYFYGNLFKTTKDTLDPRPESEVVIEAIEEVIHKFSIDSLSFLECGVGTGCLIISILKEHRGSGIGIDISSKALEVARFNANNLGVDLKLIEHNWLDGLDSIINLLPNESVKMVISNPPYISSDEFEALDFSVKNYDPHVALWGGEDGLDHYRFLTKELKGKADWLFFEVGYNQGEVVKDIGESNGWTHHKSFIDKLGYLRVVVFKS